MMQVGTWHDQDVIDRCATHALRRRSSRRAGRQTAPIDGKFGDAFARLQCSVGSPFSPRICRRRSSGRFSWRSSLRLSGLSSPHTSRRSSLRKGRRSYILTIFSPDILVTFLPSVMRTSVLERSSPSRLAGGFGGSHSSSSSSSGARTVAAVVKDGGHGPL